MRLNKFLTAEIRQSSKWCGRCFRSIADGECCHGVAIVSTTHESRQSVRIGVGDESISESSVLW